ncbi:hypothetical protein G6F59_014582 [Rhizopus arrhizus]|nr:hypothetical protein G6F59_014582 [Rhizopus arrhizus]
MPEPSPKASMSTRPVGTPTQAAMRRFCVMARQHQAAQHRDPARHPAGHQADAPGGQQRFQRAAIEPADDGAFQRHADQRGHDEGQRQRRHHIPVQPARPPGAAQRRGGGPGNTARGATHAGTHAPAMHRGQALTHAGNAVAFADAFGTLAVIMDINTQPGILFVDRQPYGACVAMPGGIGQRFLHHSK